MSQKFAAQFCLLRQSKHCYSNRFFSEHLADDKMKLSVKVLGGVECCVDAQEDYTVDQLKADIEAKLKLGKAEQKLLFKGKTLQGK